MIHLPRTVLDILEHYPDTAKVFREYEKLSQSCLICQHLFDPLENLVQQYQLDPEKLLQSLQQAADEASS